ncbi:meiotic nuclear division protein 1 homolog isoform X2 [Leptinotarsa decemlineata]|uniref:meiotic nuclear division protein 1 homolog isoform X2 n=1 Tax=Leptinotarsa decemlineata TaxID=7539 RepID=UPI003D303FA8
MQELEKIAPKEKGIVANSVKDVVQKLVEEDLVDTDKIGTSVYFWAFPSKTTKTRKRQLENLQEKCGEATKKLKILEKTVTDSKESKDIDKQRNNIIDEINDKELELSGLKQQLKSYEENDPQRFEALMKKTKELKEAINRWTDNIFAVKAWCKKKFFIEDNVLNKQFGIPEDFDYIE